MSEHKNKTTKCVMGRKRHYWGRNGRYFKKCFYCDATNPNYEKQYGRYL